jgi:[ribosomal protein S18]-alanine N-acetyltransferase
LSARLQPHWAVNTTSRAMVARDVDAVVAIEAQAYGFPWTRGNFIDSLAAGYSAEVLVCEGALIGYFVAMAGVDELHLLNITVTPDHQGRGHGTRLLGRVEELARHYRLAQLLLEVRGSNDRARGLYLRRGFVDVGLRRGYYPAAAGREDAVVMSLAIDLDAKVPDGLV